MQSKKHILIIDDEPEVAEMLKDFFKENNFKAAVITDGRKAMDYFKHEVPVWGSLF